MKRTWYSLRASIYVNCTILSFAWPSVTIFSSSFSSLAIMRKSCKLTCWPSIWDRFWWKNNSSGLCVGTSKQQDTPWLTLPLIQGKELVRGEKFRGVWVWGRLTFHQVLGSLSITLMFCLYWVHFQAQDSCGQFQPDLVSWIGLPAPNYST